MIKIEVLDPFNTPKHQLRLVAAILNNIANGEPVKISSDDRPDAGTTADEVFTDAPVADAATGQMPDPATVFANPATVFAAPNVQQATAQGAVAVSAPAPSINNAPALGVEVDAKGLPWDGRIHAKSGAGGGVKNADGTWRAKRGVEPATVAQVEAELRGAMGAPAAPNVPAVVSPVAPAPAVVTAVPLPPASVDAGNVAIATHATAPTTPTAIAPATNVGNVAPPPPVPAPTSPTVAPSVEVGATAQSAQSVVVEQDFISIAPIVTNALTTGKVTQEQLQATLQTLGLATFPMLINRKDLVPAFMQMLGL